MQMLGAFAISLQKAAAPELAEHPYLPAMPQLARHSQCCLQFLSWQQGA